MFTTYLQKTADTLRRLADADEYAAVLDRIAQAIIFSLENGGKVLFAGNGGSAADSQHLAGELVVRFREDRTALAGIALTVDTSVLTACLNDYGPAQVFSRQVEALGRTGDVFWAFSTSGNSENILAACHSAKRVGMTVVGFTGLDGGQLASLSDICFRAPSPETSHIQECHITAGHVVCWAVERHFAAVKQ